MQNSSRVLLIMLLVLTHIAPTWASGSPWRGGQPVAQREGPVNLNQADASALQQRLKGIGAVKARAIVAHREQYGPFASVDELLEVKGIGKSLLDRNRSLLTVR